MSQLECRRAIEALRAGVPSRSAVEMLGTSQRRIAAEFDGALECAAAQAKRVPIRFAADFGHGKSHLLNCLARRAAAQGFVTATVVVSPETPLGNGVAVLREVASNLRADTCTGDVLRELAARQTTETATWRAMCDWAPPAGIHLRFSALFHLYECERHDLEFRNRVLNDIQGAPITVAEIRKHLKANGLAQEYDLRRCPKMADLAHDRIRLLAALLHAFGAQGLVVLFDEVERLATFSPRQREAAYAELGWWSEQSRDPRSHIVAAFAWTRGFQHEKLADDSRRLPLGEQSLRAMNMCQGYELLRGSTTVLEEPSQQELLDLQERVAHLYTDAYSCSRPRPVPQPRGAASIRKEIRRWITIWDIQRLYPAYEPHVTAGDIDQDDDEIPDDLLGQEEIQDQG